ncbi:hypothetical protein BDZ97DRAFT_1755344 [Flammula alnicola]|nr:hypothetical protein BDZ97DRAFT_1755344 [Flammula alnicola]
MSSTASNFAPFNLAAYNGDMTSAPRRDSEMSQLAGPKNIVYANTQNLRSTMPFAYTKYDPSEPVVDLDEMDMDTLSSDKDSCAAKDRNSATAFLHKIMAAVKSIGRKVGFSCPKIRPPFAASVQSSA